MEDGSSRTGGRERLDLGFTIDDLLFNKGVKGSKEEATGSHTAEQTANNPLNHQNPEPEEVAVRSETRGKLRQRSEAETEERKVKEEEGEEETTTATSTGSGPEKPKQSYVALISKAILGSEQKKLLLCDIYQWIMDHFPYFKSKDKNWRNGVRHNLSLNGCFIKAGRSDYGKGHFWAIHSTNYQDFANGDYQCRRARRRGRREAGPIPLSYCCFPQTQRLPLSCLAPRLYWHWSSMQSQGGVHPSFTPHCVLYRPWPGSEGQRWPEGNKSTSMIGTLTRSLALSSAALALPPTAFTSHLHFVAEIPKKTPSCRKMTPLIHRSR
ncbi:Forkhead box protein B1 [Liparis tanakae]|uniref:Forkhead box protein B1 n=1 Tax=Liparis tanakae TaxID=230148 RepID=A0A4Z2IAN9_9TELE|nr:Forkhead box protein B1 [Liparis tanakae]